MTDKPIHIIVPGPPISQPRQRHGVVNGRMMNWTPTKHPVNTFKAAIQMLAQQAYRDAPMEGPVSVEILAVFPRPASRTWKNKPMPQTPKTGKPDWDNVGKAVADALAGIVYRDDSQISDAVIRKREAAGDEQPRTEITISAI